MADISKHINAIMHDWLDKTGSADDYSPSDVGVWKDTDMVKLMTFLGKSIQRLSDAVGMKAIESDDERIEFWERFILTEIELAKKYIVVIKMRLPEFRKTVRKFHSGDPLDDSFIDSQIPQICLANYLHWTGGEKESGE